MKKLSRKFQEFQEKSASLPRKPLEAETDAHISCRIRNKLISQIRIRKNHFGFTQRLSQGLKNASKKSVGDPYSLNQDLDAGFCVNADPNRVQKNFHFLNRYGRKNGVHSADQ